MSNDSILLTGTSLLDIADLKRLNESVGSKPRPEEKWTRALSFSPFVAFALDKSNKMIGFGRIESDGKVYIIYDMCVLPIEQNKGIGTMILKSLLLQAKSAGVKTVGLSAWTPEARRFYLKHGFADKGSELALSNYMEVRL